MAARFRGLSRTSAAGAIGLIEVVGDVDAVLNSLGIPCVDAGGVRLCRVRSNSGPSIEAVVARWSDWCVHLMPHAGVEVMRRCAEAIMEAGAEETDEQRWSDDRVAREGIDGALQVAIARATSPLAVDVLIEHATRWRLGSPESSAEHAAALGRLMHEPLVIAWGPPNVGKSTLLNALAGDSLSIVADEPGTTRDHVGALIDLAGVVVRYVDTPGVRTDGGAIESEALSISEALVERADLVLWCRDAASERPRLPRTRGKVMEVDLRSDLGIVPESSCAVSALDGDSVRELAGEIREALVPRQALESASHWPFWRAID